MRCCPKLIWTRQEISPGPIRPLTLSNVLGVSFADPGININADSLGLVFNVWWFLPQCWMGGTATATYASPLGFAKLNRHRSSARYNCTFLYFCVCSLCTFSVCFPSFFVKLILLGTKKKPYILRVWHYMSRKKYNKYQMLRVITIHCKKNCSI